MRIHFPSLLPIILFISLLTPRTGNAQFDVGDNVASLGVGLGGNYVSHTSASPGLALGYEHGVSDLGAGVLGIGGYVGFRTLTHRWNWGPNYEYDWRYTYLILGVRGAWHYNDWHGVSELDTYGGLMLSYNIVSWKDHTVYPSGVVRASSGSAASGLGLTGFLGARYYFSNSFGAQLELGYGVSVLNLGVAYKF